MADSKDLPKRLRVLVRIPDTSDANTVPPPKKIKRLQWSRGSMLAFVGSNPAEAVRFFRAKKSSAHLPSEGKYSHRSHVIDLRHVKDF